MQILTFNIYHMKKSLLFVACALAMMTTSCENSELLTNSAETSLVTLNVQSPEMVLRSFGDGTSATDLYYAIYDADGNIVSEISKVDEATKETINITKTLQLRLVTGNTYSMIFWADNMNDVCDVDFTNKIMTFKPTTANMEEYDAFYAYEAPFKVTGDLTKTIYLYRPFAQINVGANDFVAADAAGLKVTNSQIKLTTYSTMNLVDGTVANEVEVTYAYNNIPTGETFPVAGYEYLAMNYVLVAQEQETVDVEFSYNNGGNYVNDYTFVPVQRNYRTNIYGSILTSDVEVNVVIEPAFEEPDNNHVVD